jgi:sporulation protein YlmC with PRC-barrel domain
VTAASGIVGRQLRDRSGKNAGQIKFLVINMQNGAVDFAVVGSSGAFDIGNEVIAVPWQVLEAPHEGNTPITIKADASKLEKAPRFDPRLIYRIEARQQRAQVYGYYGYGYPPPYAYRGPGVPYAYGYGYGYPYGYGYGPPRGAPPPASGYAYGPGPAAGSSGSNGQYGSAYQGSGSSQANGRNGMSGREYRQYGPQYRSPAQQGRAQTQQGQNPQGRQLAAAGLVVGEHGVVQTVNSRNTTSANALENADVYARNGNHIGRIDEVMIDVDRGEVAYVLVARGGFLGLDEVWLAMPVEALSWNRFGGDLVLTADESRLTRLPSLPVQRNDLPTQVSAAQLAQLYDVFGMAPYWQQSGAGRQASAQSPRQGRQGRGAGSSQPQQGSGSSSQQ